jgi:large subunit ribosomal protein L3
MINTIYGIKHSQTQKYTSSGKRIPVTVIRVFPNKITQIKTKDKDGYAAVQIVSSPRKMEIRTVETVSKAIGDIISPQEVFKIGDMVNVTATSKGKGFAGVMKRHNFKGGPKTHGQSDRQRAPGSIGQTTTPGRVYKGKRMAGHMGSVTRTERNLTVMEITADNILLKGTIPGPLGVVALIRKVGEEKNFQPLLSSKGLDTNAIAEEQAAQEASLEGTAEAPSESETN